LATKKTKKEKEERFMCDPAKVASFDDSKLDKDLQALAKPAQRALVNNSIFTARDLAQWTQSNILELHGIGPSAIPIMRKCLKKQKLRFKK
jgi:hypothetical protein